MFMVLDLTSLQKAIDSLQAVLAEYSKDTSNSFMRDACIQRFEYTYELSHKMLRRFLQQTEASPGEVDKMSFPQLIRTGDERGLLLNGWDVWSRYRVARGTTSHTYDEKKAQKVSAIIPDFFKEAQCLLKNLQNHAAEN